MLPISQRFLRETPILHNNSTMYIVSKVRRLSPLLYKVGGCWRLKPLKIKGATVETWCWLNKTGTVGTGPSPTWQSNITLIIIYKHNTQKGTRVISGWITITEPI